MDINLKTYFKVMYICSLIVGILCCVTLNLLCGILLIVASTKFKNARDYSDQKLKQENTDLLVWGIVSGGLTVPIGIVGIVFAVMAHNKIEAIQTVENKTQKQTDNQPQQQEEIIIENVEPVEKTEDEKNYETLETMKRLRDNGVITEEEFEQKRKQLLGE